MKICHQKYFATILPLLMIGQPFSAKALPPRWQAEAQIPRAYWGEWRNSLNRCGDIGDSGYLILQAKNVLTQVGNPDVVKVVKLKRGVKVYYDRGQMSEHPKTAEGWTDVSVFRLSKSGNLIFETDMIGKGHSRWMRCPTTARS